MGGRSGSSSIRAGAIVDVEWRYWSGYVGVYLEEVDGDDEVIQLGWTCALTEKGEEARGSCAVEWNGWSRLSGRCYEVLMSLEMEIDQACRNGFNSQPITTRL